MADASQGAGLTPPYVGATTFRNFLSSLHETGIPPVIDTSVMTKKSGSTQAALKVALNFFGLIDGKDRVSRERLERVAKAAAGSGEAWKQVVCDELLPAYAPIAKDLPIERGTAKQLEAAFRKHSTISGSTIRKAIRFYLTMLKAGGVKHSPHFRAPKSPASTKRKKATDKEENNSTNEDSQDGNFDDGGEDLPIPKDWVVQPFNLPSRDDPVRIVMPADLTQREWKMVSAFMTLYVGDDGGNE